MRNNDYKVHLMTSPDIMLYINLQSIFSSACRNYAQVILLRG